MQQLVHYRIIIDKVNNSNIEAFVHYIYYIAHGHEGAKKAVAQSLYNNNSMNLIQISKVCSAINTFT